MISSMVAPPDRKTLGAGLHDDTARHRSRLGFTPARGRRSPGRRGRRAIRATRCMAISSACSLTKSAAISGCDAEHRSSLETRKGLFPSCGRHSRTATIGAVGTPSQYRLPSHVVTLMAIKQLNDEQIATWTRLQKDTWWYENVYRGDMPQLTVRAAITGFLLGGVLSATALYIAGKTGITIGVGLTSVILAFAMFRIMSRSGIIKDFTILENNCTQSIATASGYMVTPIVSGLAAYMMVTDTIVPWWKLMIFNVIISSIGILVAFPMKRRFINEDQLPFPEGRAAGVVLDALYTGEADGGNVPRQAARASPAAFTALYQFISSDGWMRLLQFKILRMDKWAGMAEPWHWQERFDHVLLQRRREVQPLDPEDPRHRHPPARPAPDAGCGDARRRRIDGHPRRDERVVRRAGELRGPRADHDPARRHSFVHRAERRAGRDLAPRDREPVVALVGRHDDGRRRAGRAVRQAGDLHQGVQEPDKEEGASDRRQPIRCATSKSRSGCRLSASRS